MAKPDNPGRGNGKGLPAGTFAVPDTATTDEGSGLPFLDVLGNDRGPDDLTARHVAAVDAAGTLGLVAVLPDGSGVSYDPNGAFDYLGFGESATDTFTYTHQRGQSGISQTATVTVRVSGVNDAPVAVNDGGAGFATDEDTAFTTASVLANDGDVDANDTLTVSAVNGSDAEAGDRFTLASGALLTLNADGTFAYDPNGQFEDLDDGDIATDGFTYTVGDRQGGTDTGTVTVTVTGVDDNTAPVAVVDVADTSNATTSTRIDVLANDVDADGDLLSVSAINGEAVTSAGDTVTLASGATVTLTADDILVYDPSAAPDGTFTNPDFDRFSYTVSDGNGGADTGTVVVGIGIDLSALDDVDLSGIDNVILTDNPTGGAGFDDTPADDLMIGGAGNDRLASSEGGNDVMVGGPGDDVFQISLNEGGVREIADLVDSHDEIELGPVFSKGSVELTTSGSDTEIRVDGSHVALVLGVSAESLISGLNPHTQTFHIS